LHYFAYLSGGAGTVGGRWCDKDTATGREICRPDDVRDVDFLAPTATSNSYTGAALGALQQCGEGIGLLTELIQLYIFIFILIERIGGFFK